MSPTHPRLAYVAYVEDDAGPAAIAELNRQSIRVDTPFVKNNEADFEVWRTWNGTLTVVMAEPPLLVPSSVSAVFPDLPGWAKRSSKADVTVGPSALKTFPSPSITDRKRDRAPAPAFQELEGVHS